MRRSPFAVAMFVLAVALGGPSSDGAQPTGTAQTGQTTDGSGSSDTRAIESYQVVPGSEIDTDGLERIDLAQLQANGKLEVEVNDPLMVASLDLLFDGKLATLARTLEVNPVIVTLTFSEPISVRAVRLFPTYSWCDWAVEVVPGEGGLLVRHAPLDVWSGIELAEPTETTVVRLAVLRIQRDDNVHVNEIELYG